MPLLQRLLILLAAAVMPWLAPAAVASTVVTTEQVRAELVAHAPEGIAPGKPLWLGLQIEHQPHWHTYWKNPGDSGLPTTLRWQLPAGVTAGEIAWPTPKQAADRAADELRLRRHAAAAGAVDREPGVSPATASR